MNSFEKMPSQENDAEKLNNTIQPESQSRLIGLNEKEQNSLKNEKFLFNGQEFHIGERVKQGGFEWTIKDIYGKSEGEKYDFEADPNGMTQRKYIKGSAMLIVPTEGNPNPAKEIFEDQSASYVEKIDVEH